MSTPQHHATNESQRLRALVESLRDEIQSLASRYKFTNIQVFGSVARGDSRPDSDIDFLVDLADGASLFDLAGFRRELSRLLGVEVDVVSRRALLPWDSDVLEVAVAL